MWEHVIAERTAELADPEFRAQYTAEELQQLEQRLEELISAFEEPGVRDDLA